MVVEEAGNREPCVGGPCQVMRTDVAQFMQPAMVGSVFDARRISAAGPPCATFPPNPAYRPRSVPRLRNAGGQAAKPDARADRDLHSQGLPAGPGPRVM